MSTKKKIITVIIGIEAVIIAAVIAFLFYINSDTVKANRQLELAQRYLLEENYEQAIAAFEVVIEIDLKNAEAYLGLAEAYEAADDIENMVKVLERGSKRTDSDEIRELLEEYKEEIEKKELAAQRAAEAAQAASDASQTNSNSVVNAAEAPSVQTESLEVERETPVLSNETETIETVSSEIVTIETIPPQEESASLNAPWKQVYIDFIQNRQNSTNNALKYGLVYLDNDDIPELVESNGTSIYIESYYGGEVHEGGLAWCYGSFSYMERQNMFVFDDDVPASYILHMADGEVIVDASGRYQPIYDEEGNWISSYYEWTGKGNGMSIEEYEQQYRMVKDMGTEWRDTNGYTADQIISIIVSF